MKIIISNSSPTPIYKQIKESIISQIISGDLVEGELLPSIRTLAKDIRISVMTIKKAYDELENDGYIVTIHGKGSYVSLKNQEMIREQKQKEIEDYILKIIQISNCYSINREEIIDLFDYLYKSEE